MRKLLPLPRRELNDTGSRFQSGFLSMLQEALLPREKLAVFAILFLLVTFTALAFGQKHQRLHKIQPTLKVHCFGAIKEAKTVELAHGSSLSDLLAQVELTEEADVAKLVLEERLKNGQFFVVPRKHQMSLYITGAVRQVGLVFVPEGIRFNQLKRYLDLSDRADLAVFRRRRRLLKEGETIHIPSRAAIIGEKVVVQKEEL